ncbi:MAG: glycosyltransferase [Planctomycetota bacterium]|nr:glycosyltransferase [Planctomycetota bacterium]
MPSLMELVERVNKGEMIEPELLEVYQDSPNSAEKFLAHHARAMLDLRRAQQHMLQSLEAIEYSDQKVLNQFISVSGFLGLSESRAQPIVKFGASAIGRREYSLGLEALQNGVAFDLQCNGTYTSERENCLFIATQYERVAQCVNWTAPSATDWNNKQTKIAYIVSGVGDDDSSGRMLVSLAKFHDSKRYTLGVYSTESGVRRDKQQFQQASYLMPSGKRGAGTIEALGQRKVPTWIAPTDADAISAAKALADRLVADQVDVAIFDATQADPIAAVVAGWDSAKIKINLCRKSPLYAPGIGSVVYLDQARWEADKEFWTRRSVDSRFILEGCDTDEAFGAPPQRSVYGIPDAAVVLATAGTDLDRNLSSEFVDTVINILRAHPHAIFLVIGDGELAWQKRRFESAGVGKRVGYAGRRKDLPGFLRICDVYLAEFPRSSAAGVLYAMSVERPVVATRWGDEAEQSQAAALVGSEGAITGRESGMFIERVSKLIREPAYRQKLGKTMRQRVESHFSFNQTAQHIEQLCDQLIQARGENIVVPQDDSEGRVSLAEVA